jgi:Glycosyl hydrolases family 18
VALLAAGRGLLPSGASSPSTPTPATGGPGSSAAAFGPTAEPLVPRELRHGGTELYDFLPYWEMSESTAAYLTSVPLTSLELFSVGATKSGVIGKSSTGYKRITGPIGAGIIAGAHARGQRVELVFSSFGVTRNEALFGLPAGDAVSPSMGQGMGAEGSDGSNGASSDGTAAGPSTAASKTVAGLVALVQQLGVDGVNVDVEDIDVTAYVGYGAFIGALREQLRAIDPRLRLSVATMASAAGANLAAVALQAGADRIFLMGYGFHWSGSDPGGTAAVSRIDGRASLSTAIDLYAAAGIPRSHILLGLPLFGMSWTVTSPERYATEIGKGQTWVPARHIGELTAAAATVQLDDIEISEFLSQPIVTARVPVVPTWQATFYDSPRTLRVKLGIARAAGYAGSGFWALGYERGLPGYTDLMADFLAGRVAPAWPDVIALGPG